MESNQVLKGVIESLPAKTGSGYAGGQEGDLIQLYANDGTPNGKISRDALMSCVKDSLGTLLNQGAADLGTSLAKIPALNSGGTLGSATVANLASVLGGLDGETLLSSDNLDTLGFGKYNAQADQQSYPTNSPWPAAYSLICEPFANDRVVQIAIRGNETKIRIKWGTWTSWFLVSTDIPDFYKDYANLNALGSALNVGTLKSYVARSNKSAYIYIKINSGYNSALISLAGQFAVSKPQIINLYFMNSTVYSATGYIYELAKVYFRTEGSAGVFYIGNASLTCTMLCYTGTIDERVVEAGVVSSLPSDVVEVPVS